MNYWLAGTSFGEKNHLDDFVEYSYWEGGDVAKSNIMNAIKSVKKGDVIIAKTTGKKGPGHSISYIRIKAIGVIASDIHVVDDGNNWYQCKVVWKKLSEDREFEGSAYGKYLGTMHLCMENEIKTFAMQCLKADGRVFENVLKYVESLKVSKNIILHGAPGTGKTYLAREIAKAMGCTKDEMEFVQFHPSYDYTDFVEGLRPTPPNENGQIGFERKDGVFKEFCNKALKKNRPEADNFEEAWENFLSSLEANECVLEIESVSGKPIDVELTGSGVLLVHPKKDGKWTKIDTLYLNHDQVYRVYKGKKGVDSGALDNYRKAVVEKMKKDCGLKDYNPSTEDNSKTTPHVFIIDEINRGDMSKIFGELFFSIDPGYRGVEGTVKTQYANIADGTSRFDEILHNESDLKKILKKNLDVAHYVKEPSSNGYFFIPENVYIIGTMNDIDRSVESMDFAMRRRFVFEEIKAEDSAKNFNPPLSTEALKRMTNLNKAIWDESAKDKEKKGISGLSSAYHIGPAYFKDFKDGDNTEDFWNRRLKGLLSEYLRGTRSAVADLETLHNAFMMKDGSEQSNSETPKQDAES